MTKTPKPSAPAAPKFQRVREPVAAELLIDSRRNRFLRPFLARECGVAEAARELGVGKSLVSYWVGRLIDAGLLKPAVAGAARHKAYRSTADAFLVDLKDAPQDSDATILAANMDPGYDRIKEAVLRAARRHAAHWEFRFQRTPVGVRQDLVPRGGDILQARIVNQRAVLHLSDADAAAMRDELDALMKRYGDRSGPAPGRRRVLVWACAVDDFA